MKLTVEELLQYIEEHPGERIVVRRDPEKDYSLLTYDQIVRKTSWYIDIKKIYHVPKLYDFPYAHFIRCYSNRDKCFTILSEVEITMALL